MKRLLATIPLLLSACAIGGQGPALTRIAPGMSQGQVSSILGEPVQRIALEGGGEHWDYTRVAVRFGRNGRVEVITGREI